MAPLIDKIKSGGLIVDVRSASEFEDGHYPNAINIPVDQVQKRISDFGDKNKPVIVYCQSGARSAYAAKILRVAGYTDVTNAGGLDDMPGQ